MIVTHDIFYRTTTIDALSTRLHRGPAEQIVVYITNAGRAYTLAAGDSLKLNVKPEDERDDALLFSTTITSAEYVSTQGYYLKTFSTVTTAVDTHFGVDGANSADDIVKETLHGVMTFTPSGGNAQPGDVFEFEFQVTPYDASEASPVAAASPDDEWVAHGHAQTLTTPQKAQARTNIGALGTADLAGLLEFQGSIDASTDPNYPVGSSGDCYVISVAGHVGGGSGKVVEIGDLLVCTADNAGGTEAGVGTSWTVIQANIAGMTAAGLSMIQAADAAAQRVLLELGTTDRPSFENLQLAVATPSYAATHNLDFDGEGFEKIAITGDITFTDSNLAAGRSKTVRIVCDATPRNLTFPASWVWVGNASHASIAASKTGILTVTSFGTTDGDCVAAWAVEP